MKYDRAFFDRGLNRRGTNCAKWDAKDVVAPGDIPLWVADMDFACAEEIVEDLKKRAEHPCYGYTFSGEADQAAFISFWKTRHQVTISEEDMVMLPCVVTGLKIAVQSFSSPGDEVIIMEPVYGPFAASVTVNGRRVAACPLIRDEAGRYHMDLNAVEDKLKAGVRLVLFCNPHNPVARLWRYEELEQLVNLVKSYQGVLVSDEIHADFVYAPGEFVSAMRFDAFKECGVALCSASKTFNIAGLQQAEAVIPNPDLRKALQGTLSAAGVLSGNIFAMTAARSAYEKGAPWLDALLPYLKDNADHMASRLRQELPDALISPVEATYLAWLDLRAYAPDCETLKEKFAKAGVSLTLGTFFGEAYEGYARLNFGCPRAQLDEGINRIVKALKEA